MSELTSARNNGRDLRWQLLATVSALALLAAVYGSSEAKAADQDADRPTVWIELGGQLEQMNNSQEAFSPPFMASITQTSFLSALDVQRPSAFAVGGEGKISFQPEGRDWVFSASVRYGRSNAARKEHHQTSNPNGPNGKGIVYHLPTLAPYIGHFGITSTKRTIHGPGNYTNLADGTARQSETHTVLDFQAGKDVGLGLFGRQGTSVLSAGVRFALFTSQAHATLRARSDYHITPSKPISSIPAVRTWKYSPIHFHDHTAIANSRHSFRGIGPSLAWNASAPFAGSSERGELTFDWGANAAILFGRQKVTGHHQTTTRTYSGRWFNVFTIPILTPHVKTASINRARTVIVPNLGGFAGLSFLYSNAKVSFGYRGDFFFGAMDGGIDTPKSETRGFYGPFASISIGIGR